MKVRLINKFLKLISLLLVLVLVNQAHGTSSNIDTTDKWAWNDIAGWIDFRVGGAGAYVDDNKVTNWGVFDDNTSTYVALHCADIPPSGNYDCPPNFGIANNDGSLSGYAWSDEYGWISFYGTTPDYQVVIGADGAFSGFAWNDVIGWISFNCVDEDLCGTSDYKVATSWLPTNPPVVPENYLESVTYDTGSTDGFAINSIYWKGSKPAGSVIGFQLAVATSTDFSGVEFRGEDGSPSTMYEATDVDGGEAIIVNSLHHNPFESNYRYFRYRVYLDKSFTSPEVTQVSINWSR